MMVASIQRCTAVVSMMLLMTAALGQQPAIESPVTSKMKQRDARLKTPVSFSADRIYLGELLEKLSQQTKVSISMDANDSFSGVEITCDLKRMALADVMNSLWSLLGNKNGSWEWSADTRHPQPRYQLRATSAAHRESDRLNRLRQEAFEQLSESLLRMAALPPAERRVSEKKLPPFMRIDDPENEIALVSAENRGNFWAGIHLFGTLSPELRQRVLRGQKIEVLLATLSEQDRREALTLEPAESGRGNYPKREASGTLPDRVCFQRINDSLPNAGQLVISLGNAHSLGGRTYFGIQTTELFPRTVQDWIFPGDRPMLERDEEKLPALTAFKPESLWEKAPRLDRNIAQLAATEGVSFLAVLPEEPVAGFPIETAKTPRLLFWEAGQHGQPLMHKWRNGVLLVSYPGWFYGDETQYPYRVVAHLRASLQKQERLLSLQDILEPVNALTEKQRWRLSAEFPPVRPSVKMDAICTFYSRYPNAEQGVPFDQNLRSVLQDLRFGSVALEPDEKPERVRLVDTFEGSGAPPQHRYTLQLMTSKSRFIELTSVRIERLAPYQRAATNTRTLQAPQIKTAVEP